MLVSFFLPDDEFDEEPEDELASAGMHATTDNGTDDDNIDEDSDPLDYLNICFKV